MNDGQTAYEELLRKSLKQIQVETAFIWASRARAAYRLVREAHVAGRPDEAFAWSIDATEYEHEALEHGALAGDSVLAQVRLLISAS